MIAGFNKGVKASLFCPCWKVSQLHHLGFSIDSHSKLAFYTEKIFIKLVTADFYIVKKKF